MPSLSARANLLAARGDWMGALTDLDMALTSRPNDPHLRLRRGELLLRQGDWLRGLGDYEARLELPGDRYAPDLPRWQGEPLAGRLLIYPEQADIESDAALRDTLMLARGVDAVVQCAPRARRMARHADDPARRGARWICRSGTAAQPAASPGLDARSPAAARRACGRQPSRRPRVGWFADSAPPAGIDVERNPERAGDVSPGGRRRHLARRILRHGSASRRSSCCRRPPTGCGARSPVLRPGISPPRSCRPTTPTRWRVAARAPPEFARRSIRAATGRRRRASGSRRCRTAAAAIMPPNTGRADGAAAERRRRPRRSPAAAGRR